MALSTTDQVNFATGLSVTTNGVPANYNFGDILPPATSDADNATRTALRAAGALRMVTYATTAADFAAAVTAAANAGQVQAGSDLPVIADPGGMPVIASYSGD